MLVWLDRDEEGRDSDSSVISWVKVVRECCHGEKPSNWGRQMGGPCSLNPRGGARTVDQTGWGGVLGRPGQCLLWLCSLEDG